MENARRTRKGLIAAAVLVPILLVAALWLPVWWERWEFRQAQAIAGVGSQIVGGHITEARKKIDPGVTAEQIVAQIGKPSFSVGTSGKNTRHDIWTYYFTDGTMTVNLTDGAAVRISMVYGPPRIPRSTRPEAMGSASENR
jgi:hypothetical protein